MDQDITTSVIVGPDGSPASVPTIILTQEAAALLRLYKKFLEAHRLREALYCQECWDGQNPDGCEAYVTDHQILIRCRHRILFYQGATY